MTEVVADNFQMLESRSAREGGQQGGGYTPSQSQPTNSNFGGNQPSQTQSSPATPDFGRDSDPFSGGTPMNLSDDDLPF